MGRVLSSGERPKTGEAIIRSWGVSRTPKKETISRVRQGERRRRKTDGPCVGQGEGRLVQERRRPEAANRGIRVRTYNFDEGGRKNSHLISSRARGKDAGGAEDQ